MDRPKNLFFLNPVVLVHLSRVHKTKVLRGTIKKMLMNKVKSWDTYVPPKGTVGAQIPLTVTM